jgi:hypothetical protein
MHGVHDDGTAYRHDEDETKDKTGLEQRIREAGY